jgi:putative ABC transport system permease protein
MSPRWRKLLGDARAERGRFILMLAAVGVSLFAIGTVLGAYSILTREMATNYMGTRPASATLEIEGGVSPALLEEVRKHPDIAAAEPRRVLVARAKVGLDWRPLLLFVIDDFQSLRLNTFDSLSGQWPPVKGSMLIERSAIQMMETTEGGSILVKAPNSQPREIPVVGVVHDPGLAPAWQERAGYGYITKETLAALGEAQVLDELRIEVKENALSIKAIEETSEKLAHWMVERGEHVHQLRIPPPAQHPHQRQMESVLLLLIAFSTMTPVLSAILVANSLSAMLARQVREIGVMKSLGARSTQLFWMYLTLVSALGIISALLAAPLSLFAARGMSGGLSRLLNLELTSLSIPYWVFLIQGIAGVLIPVLLALIPIRSASRVTAREAMAQHGVSGVSLGVSSLPMPIRNALRRPRRLLLTLGLLSVGGAMFMTALNVSRSWERNLDKVYETRFYDVEVRFNSPQPSSVAAMLRGLSGVKLVEPWGFSEAAIAKEGRIDIVRTYPDRGHGSFSVLAPPFDTTLIKFPLLAGRWLSENDTDAVVLNHSARAQAGYPNVGDAILLSIDGEQSRWRIVGIVEEIGSSGVAYITDDAFAKTMKTPDRSRLLRVVTSATSPIEREDTIRRLNEALLQAGVSVDAVLPFAELRTAIGDHMIVLIRLLLAMAFIMALVGAMGLAATMSTNVIERTRELGVMKVLGARPSRIVWLLLMEAFFIAALSWVLAFALALPLTISVNTLVGMMGFLAPLPLVIGVTPPLLWLFLVALVSLLATLLPARSAVRLSAREAMSQV